MARYVVIDNTPGYLPEDIDPLVTDDYSEAVAYVNDLAAGYEADGWTVTYGLASSANLCAVSAIEDGEHSLPRFIAVELDEN